MSILKAEPTDKEEPEEPDVVFVPTPVITILEDDEAEVTQKKPPTGGGFSEERPIRSSSQDAAASSFSSSSHCVNRPVKLKLELHHVKREEKKQEVKLEDVKLEDLGKKKKKGPRPPRRLLRSLTAPLRTPSRRIKGKKSVIKCELPPPRARKGKMPPAVRVSGVRYINWEKTKRRWVVKYLIDGKPKPHANFSIGKYLPKGANGDNTAEEVEEAVAKALAEAKEYLVMARKRSSGVPGVTWHKRDKAWRVRKQVKAAGRRFLFEKDTRFYPTDMSDAAIEEARLKAVPCRKKLEARYQAFVQKSRISTGTELKNELMKRVRDQTSTVVTKTELKRERIKREREHG